MSRTLKPYMGFVDDPSEGAVLIFAHTAKEAKRLFWDEHRGDVAGDEFIEIRVNLLRKKDWLFLDADQDKLKAGVPHTVISPRSCECCGSWGHEPIEGSDRCATCLKGDCDKIHHA